MSVPVIRYSHYGLAAIFMMTACVSEDNSEFIVVDPLTTWVPDEATALYDADPLVEMGFYAEQIYEPLEDGSECPIVSGLQGGTWTMPAIRTLGIASMAWVECQLIAAHGEDVGSTSVQTQFFLGQDHYYEIQSFPIPFYRSGESLGESIEGLYGQQAHLTCSVQGQGGGASKTVEVTLVEY